MEQNARFMSGHLNANFDDSSLKTAIRGAWGNQRAPEALRRRVGMIAASAQPRENRFRIAWRPLAAAAVLIVGLGSFALQVIHLRPPRFEPPPHYALAPDLMQELIHRHDAQVSMSVRHGGATRTVDFTQMAAEFKEKLRLTVMAASVGPDFEFEGAALLTLGVNKLPAAQLIFRRGEETLSVFSMSAAAVPETRQLARYSGQDTQHSLRGVVQNGGFYCIVGSGAPADCGADAGVALRTLQLAFPPRCAVPQGN